MSVELAVFSVAKHRVDPLVGDGVQAIDGDGGPAGDGDGGPAGDGGLTVDPATEPGSSETDGHDRTE